MSCYTLRGVSCKHPHTLPYWDCHRHKLNYEGYNFVAAAGCVVIFEAKEGRHTSEKF